VVSFLYTVSITRYIAERSLTRHSVWKEWQFVTKITTHFCLTLSAKSEFFRRVYTLIEKFGRNWESNPGPSTLGKLEKILSYHASQKQNVQHHQLWLYACFDLSCFVAAINSIRPNARNRRERKLVQAFECKNFKVMASDHVCIRT